MTSTTNHTGPAQGRNRFHVTALCGRSHTFETIPAHNRRAVVHVDVDAIGADLLAKVLDVFGLDDHDHLSEIRIPARPGPSGCATPMSPSDVVYRLWADKSHEHVDHSHTPLTAMVDEGAVFYLRFDLGDEWWWRCEFTGSALTGYRKDKLSTYTFVQYPKKDTDGNCVVAERREPTVSYPNADAVHRELKHATRAVPPTRGVFANGVADIRRLAQKCQTQREIIESLGLKYDKRNRENLQSVAAANNIKLPAKGRRPAGRSPLDDAAKVRAAVLTSSTKTEALAKLHMSPTGKTNKRLAAAALRFGVDAPWLGSRSNPNDPDS
jgi:hypothetical protein